MGSTPTWDTFTFLAQLVEHEAFNLRVAGSTPAESIFFDIKISNKMQISIFPRAQLKSRTRTRIKRSLLIGISSIIIFIARHAS